MVLLLKLLAIFFYPLGFSLALLITGIALFIRRNALSRFFLIGGAAVLYVFSTPVWAYSVIRFLEKPYYEKPVLPKDCSAIVVLGGSGVPMGYPRRYPEINAAGDRLLHAARLYRFGIAHRVITTGGFSVGSFHQKVTEGEHNAMLLREIGVDSAAILIDPKSLTTADHGPIIGTMLDSLGLPKKIILVTTASHMLRSLAVFKKNGFEVFPAATDFRSSMKLVNNIRDFFPDAAALQTVTTAFHEIYGIIGYRMFGKI